MVSNDHNSLSWCGECLDDSTNFSMDEYPETHCSLTNISCLKNSPCTPKKASDSWGRQVDALNEGNYMKCCCEGLVGRVVDVAKCLTYAPAQILSSAFYGISGFVCCVSSVPSAVPGAAVNVIYHAISCCNCCHPDCMCEPVYMPFVGCCIGGVGCCSSGAINCIDASIHCVEGLGGCCCHECMGAARIHLLHKMLARQSSKIDVIESLGDAVT